MPLKRLWSSPGPGQSQARDPHALLACREERVWPCARPLRHGGTMKAMSSPGSRRFPVAVTRIPVTPCQIRRRTAACGQAASARCSLSTTAEPTPQRPASRPGSQSHRPHNPPTLQRTLPAEGGLSAWAAQMTSVATERDRAMVRARARSRRYERRFWSAAMQLALHRTVHYGWLPAARPCLAVARLRVCWPMA